VTAGPPGQLASEVSRRCGRPAAAPLPRMMGNSPLIAADSMSFAPRTAVSPVNTMPRVDFGSNVFISDNSGMTAMHERIQLSRNCKTPSRPLMTSSGSRSLTQSVRKLWPDQDEPPGLEVAAAVANDESPCAWMIRWISYPGYKRDSLLLT